MESMKVGDVFKLPMSQGITCVISEDHRHEIVFDESDSNVDEQIEIVAYCLNNHDRLAEGNAELLEMLKRLIGNGVDLLNVDDVEDEEDAASIHAKFNDVINEAGSLLAKHK